MGKEKYSATLRYTYILHQLILNQLLKLNICLSLIHGFTYNYYLLLKPFWIWGRYYIRVLAKLE